MKIDNKTVHPSEVAGVDIPRGVSTVSDEDWEKIRGHWFTEAHLKTGAWEVIESPAAATVESPAAATVESPAAATVESPAAATVESPAAATVESPKKKKPGRPKRAEKPKTQTEDKGW